ncbi:MAG: acetyl-CoA carboxylase biotin carboxyl carrier protein subunit [Firmicutes bacterium]|nr:acetyl-CoA carboxylase biotin carboxyl carrier protein subunit [Bacillota bacterium]
MKNYRITVNGNSYDVQVEELSGSVAPAVQTVNTDNGNVASTPAPAPVQASAPAPAPAGEGSVKVTSPMPGNILDIKVKTGDKVEANQCVIILEAMKMENEIVTPSAGVVASVNVAKGQTVASGDVLITVAE